MPDIDAIHTMSPEQLLDYVIMNSGDVAKNLHRQDLVKNRIMKLQNYLKRCSDLVNLLSEDD